MTRPKREKTSIVLDPNLEITVLQQGLALGIRGLSRIVEVALKHWLASVGGKEFRESVLKSEQNEKRGRETEKWFTMLSDILDSNVPVATDAIKKNLIAFQALVQFRKENREASSEYSKDSTRQKVADESVAGGGGSDPDRLRRGPKRSRD